MKFIDHLWVLNSVFDRRYSRLSLYGFLQERSGSVKINFLQTSPDRMNVVIICVTLSLPFWRSGVGVIRLWCITPQRLLVIAHVNKSTKPNGNGAKVLTAPCQSWWRSVKMELGPPNIVGCKFKQRVFRNSAVLILLVEFRSLHEGLNFSIFFPTTSFLELVSFHLI
jgi:hypothetical protein